MNAIVGYNIERWFYLHHMQPLAKIVRALIYFFHNSYIPYTAEIGKGTKFGYKGIGVVIHSRAVIGKNCIVAQNVTLGGRTGHKGIPHIGDNVYIGAGAIVLGGVSVGNNAIIGANAVVLNNIPDNGDCAGVPARLLYIKNGEEEVDYNMEA